MKWGIELWDQFDNLSAHAQRGVEFCEKFSNFIKERCSIESEYAAKLKKLTKTNKLKKKEDENDFTWLGGFYGMVSEVHDIAGQHEVIVEHLTSNVLKGIQHLMLQLKQDRKKFIQDATKLTSNNQVQLALLDKIKKQYERAHKEAEKAQEIFKLSDENLNVTKAEVEKNRLAMVQRDQACERSKIDYVEELQRTNHAQRQHYDTLVPDVFGQLQQTEESRIMKISELIKSCAEAERKVLPIVDKCIDGMIKSAENVSAEQDCKAVIEKFKSGFVSPGDIPIEIQGPPLTAVSPDADIQLARCQTPPQSVRRNDSLKTSQGVTVKKKKSFLEILKPSKKDDDTDDFSHLPPNQQKKKLLQRINSVKATLAKETAERDGLLKMQDVYRQNLSLGDPESINKLLEENAVKLDKQQQLLIKYQGYLADSDATRTAPSQDFPWSTGSKKPGSVSSSQQSSAPDTPEPSTGSNDSSRASRMAGDCGEVETRDHEEVNGSSPDVSNDLDNFDEVETSIIGTCTAQYDFEAPTEGSLSMAGGELFSILEKDQGDGWTLARRVGENAEEGFIPTSYIECKFFKTES